MEITYDPRYNIDLSPDGKVYGIELPNAREQLIKGKKISFVDEVIFRFTMALGIQVAISTENSAQPLPSL